MKGIQTIEIETLQSESIKIKPSHIFNCEQQKNKSTLKSIGLTSPKDFPIGQNILKSNNSNTTNSSKTNRTE